MGDCNCISFLDEHDVYILLLAKGSPLRKEIKKWIDTCTSGTLGSRKITTCDTYLLIESGNDKVLLVLQLYMYLKLFVRLNLISLRTLLMNYYKCHRHGSNCVLMTDNC